MFQLADTTFCQQAGCVNQENGIEWHGEDILVAWAPQPLKSHTSCPLHVLFIPFPGVSISQDVCDAIAEVRADTSATTW